MIIYISRMLTNVLDEGSKNFVTNLLRNITIPVSVFTDDTFNIELSKTVQPIKIGNDSLADYSVTFRIKGAMLKTLLKYKQIYDHAHFFFTLNRRNCMVILFVSHVMKIDYFITAPVIKPDELKSKVVRFALKKANKIIVFTQYTRKIVSLYSDKVTVIPPMVHREFYKPINIRLRNKKKIKVKLKISSEYIVLFPGEYGRLDSNENIINIIKRVNSIDKNILFVLCCRLKKKADAIIQDYIRKCLVGASVLYLNTVPNFSEYLFMADLTIFPVKSMHGKFDLPLSLVESVVTGTPVLFSDIPPLNELYGEESYIRIDRNNWRGFAETILRLKNDPLLYQQYINTTLTAAERYKPDAIVKQYEKLYKS